MCRSVLILTGSFFFNSILLFSGSLLCIVINLRVCFMQLPCPIVRSPSPTPSAPTPHVRALAQHLRRARERAEAANVPHNERPPSSSDRTQSQSMSLCAPLPLSRLGSNFLNETNPYSPHSPQLRAISHIDARLSLDTAVAQPSPLRRPHREPAERHDLGRMNIACRHSGALHWMDEHVVRSALTSSGFRMCCKHGKVHLDPLPEPPVPI